MARPSSFSVPEPVRFRFSAGYFLTALVLFVTEVLIALYTDDDFIRPYFGDFLVVILMYTSIRACWILPVRPLLTGVFLFSCAIEAAQYLELVKRLGLQDSPVARTVLGTAFSWNDIGAYASGCAAVALAEWLRKRPRR